MEEEKDEAASRTHLCLLLSILPEDLIINNILLKLPVRSVMRLRCVCKYFWSLTTSPTFVNLLLDHAKTDQLINNHPASILISYLDKLLDRISSSSPVRYVWKSSVAVMHSTTTSCDLSSSSSSSGEEDNTVVVFEDLKIPCAHRSTWPMHTFQIWGSCNGLLCVVEAGEWDVLQRNCFPCIWNPCTKEFKRLPPMELDMISRREGFGSRVYYGFGYDHTMNDYKVIIWINWEPTGSGVPSESVINVYTLGGGGAWRRVPCKPYGGIRNQMRLVLAGLYFGGALHWVIIIRTSCDGPYRKQIVSFDIEAEAILELVPRPPRPHPHGCSSDHNEEGMDEDWVLQELRGCLCLLTNCRMFTKKCIIDVWMMKDYLVNGGGCWTNLFTIVVEPTAAPSRCLFISGDPWLIPLRFCENGEFLMLENAKGLCMYDPKKKITRSIRETRDIRSGINFFCIETYIESLVSLKTVFP